MKGLDEVLRRLNKEVEGIKGRSARGLLRAGLKVQREAQKRVPVEYGVLRQSAFTRKMADEKNRTVVVVGFTAAYAGFVHENLAMVLKGKPRPSGLGVYWGPQGEARFLANAVDALHDDIVRTIAQDAKVKS